MAEQAGLGVPSIGDVIGWGLALGAEVARLPTTVADARRVMTVLPDHLGHLAIALDRFTKLLDESLGEVRDELRVVGGRLGEFQSSLDEVAGQIGTTTSSIDEALPGLSRAVHSLDHRLEGIDALLGEVGGTLVGTINSVPGLRRLGKRAKAVAPGTLA